MSKTIDEEYELLLQNTLPAKAIAEDKRLSKLEAEAGESLGALRYEWCVVKGMTQRAYAEQVGVVQSAVSQSIARYQDSHPELIDHGVINSRAGAGRPYKEAPKQARKKGTYSPPTRDLGITKKLRPLEGALAVKSEADGSAKHPMTRLAAAAEGLAGSLETVSADFLVDEGSLVYWLAALDRLISASKSLRKEIVTINKKGSK